jgi:tRNA threonylcarbamoyladenosine biosynthesis protein TsaB
VVPILDAKKREVYAAAYRVTGDTPDELASARVLPPAALGEWLASFESPVLVGTGVAAYREIISDLGAEVLPDTRSTPSATSVARLALAASESSDLAAAAPTYVRLSEAELKWNQR